MTIINKKFENKDLKIDYVEDGFGNFWNPYCFRCNKKSIIIVRPGYAKCKYCDD